MIHVSKTFDKCSEMFAKWFIIVWYMYQTVVKHLSNIYETFTKQLSSIYQTFSKALWNMCQTFSKRLSNMYQIFIKHAWHIYQRLIKHSVAISAHGEAVAVLAVFTSCAWAVIHIFQSMRCSERLYFFDCDCINVW